MIDSLSIKPPVENGHSLGVLFRKLAAKPWLPFLLGFIFIFLDCFSGPYIQFPVLFVISVSLAAWFGSLRNAVLLSIGQPLLNLVASFTTDTGIPGMPPLMLAMNSGIRAAVLTILAYFIWRSSRQRIELEKRVGLLRGEIPTCISCGKAEDEQKNWIPLTVYVARHTGANFSEAICPACVKRKYVSSHEG